MHEHEPVADATPSLVPATEPHPAADLPSARTGHQAPNLLYVPVCTVPAHTDPGGAVSLRMARLGDGERVALAFTSAARLRAAMGPSQQWTRVAMSALRSMSRPLGVNRVQVDALVVAPGTPAGPLRPRDAADGPRRTRTLARRS
ncbi:type III secretion system (T3SS) SseB-like protein [Murinocardiopsis flavida]|uniref:Type III secretion system (T3SS) SseB-like protein n=1 Tax=Murinocardiopsis flavida TaxID=645275 RepID=A0A2P8C9F6_9ACTN|nr:SAV_915 family protein [Murinocardiopsis flavida]PSK81599.1 type III secretion system (T3SS) SseB-like protein [Murinocardiopsis flavida]